MRCSAVIVAALLGINGQAAFASDTYLGGGTETIKLMVGGVLTRFEDTASFNGAVTDGTPIDLNGGKGSDLKQSIALSAEWRVTRRNRVGLLYFSDKRSKSFTTTRDYIVDDTLIPAGAGLDASVRSSFLFANYKYSFIKNERFELAGLIGLYGASYKFNIAATGIPDVCIDGTCSPRSGSYQNTQSTTLPLPLIGGAFNWYISPRWEADVSLSGLHAKIGKVSGSDWVLAASTDYMIWHNVGVGVAYMHSSIGVDVTRDSFNGRIDGHSNNLLGYLLVKF
jgi:hypothetical protein